MAKMGPPSKYKKEYCKTVYDYMAKGNSVSAAAELIGVHRDTLYDWSERHEEWRDAFLRARQASCAYWEKQIEAIAMGEVDGKTANAQVKSLQMILGCRHRDLYGQASKQELTVKNDKEKLSDEELNKQIEMYMAKTAADKADSDNTH